MSKLLVRFAPNELAKLDLPANQKELQGFLVESMLGKGFFGVAFDIGSGRVLKLTEDSADAMSCQAVMHAGGVDGVAKIFDVFQFPTPLKGWGSTYGIVLEKVISFSELKERVQKETGKRLTRMLDAAFMQLYEENQFPKLNEQPEKDIRKIVRKWKLSQEEIDTAVRWAEQLVRTLVELRHLHVFVWDLHPQNAGFKINGENLDLVLFDLGNRSFRGQSEVRLAANASEHVEEPVLLQPKEVAKLPIGSIVFVWKDRPDPPALVVIPGGNLTQIALLPERSDGEEPGGCPVDAWGENFVLVKKGQGKLPTHGTAQRAAIDWMKAHHR